MALAVGFMQGAKTTGLAFGSVLAGLTLFELRRNKVLLLKMTGILVVAGLLFGSVETYIESIRLYGDPLGPTQIHREHSNVDGIRGGVANLSRYALGNIYLGPTTWKPSIKAVEKLADFERVFLRQTDLWNAGTYKTCPDQILFFHHTGFEEASGYGPIGTLTLVMILISCFWWQPKKTWWKLSFAAFSVLCIISLSVAYMNWNARFLLGAFTLGTAACICFLWDNEANWRIILRWIFSFIATIYVIASPLLSFNRGPDAIFASIFAREQFESCTHPLNGEIRKQLRNLHAMTPLNRIYIVASEGDAILPFLVDPALDAIVLRPEQFISLSSTGGVATGDIVVQKIWRDSPIFEIVTEVTAENPFQNTIYSQKIYRFVQPL